MRRRGPSHHSHRMIDRSSFSSDVSRKRSRVISSHSSETSPSWRYRFSPQIAGEDEAFPVALSHCAVQVPTWSRSEVSPEWMQSSKRKIGFGNGDMGEPLPTDSQIPGFVKISAGLGVVAEAKVRNAPVLIGQRVVWLKHDG